MNFNVASANSLIIYFGNEISTEVSQITVNAYNLLKLSKIAGLIDIIPSYTSVLVTYDIFLYDYKKLCEIIKIYLSTHQNEITQNNRKLVRIPVYYGEDVGLDLQKVASRHQLDINSVISIHTAYTYSVFAIGFAPGFAYCGEVNKKIATPRLDTPRTKVSKGSVGIANNQTAIYPSDSPGGWNILGKTNFEMFDKNLNTLCPVKVGDKIQFIPITREQFIEQGGII